MGRRTAIHCAPAKTCKRTWCGTVVGKPAFIRKSLNFWRRHRLSTERRRDTFQHIYESNLWLSEDSRSGHGSSHEQTETVRAALPALIEAFEIRSIADVPCGDFHWMQHVDLKGAYYLGIDIVDDLIKANRQRHAGPDRDFITLDIAETPPPGTDLIFCRDLLVHFSFADIKRTLANIKKSGAPYLLTTTFPETARNENILTGNWRRLNLQKAPFKLPTPLRLINENCTEDDGAYRDKSLGLWKTEDL